MQSAVRPSHNRGMEIFSAEFLAALGAIVVIDLVLAGDNAIVIALAARNVPRHLQKRAVAWGTVGAIVVRSLMTMLVVWLLQVPGLLFAGGVALIWIAYKLLLPEEAAAEAAHADAGATSFWGAMRTIVIADAVMGLDNVLAVAGAAQGSYLLVVLGLAISVPIVIWGSTLMLKWVERYPVIVYFGSGVLAWTAVKMIAGEPLLKDAASEHTLLLHLLYLAVIAGVLGAGFLHNHRRLESRISARLALLAGAAAATPVPESTTSPGGSMKRILVPADGSRNSLFGVRHALNEFLADPGVEIHLLNVQAPLRRDVAQFLGRNVRAEYHREQGEKALAEARALLVSHKVPHEVHIRLGDRAATIVDEANRLECQRIIMSTARKSSITRMIEDSTTNRVLELTKVPVELVAGDDISRLERYGVPAGLGAALALLIAAEFD